MLRSIESYTVSKVGLSRFGGAQMIAINNQFDCADVITIAHRRLRSEIQELN